MNSQESPRSMGEAGGYWDGFVNGDDSFHKVMNMLDFPLESVEGDKCVVAENWEAQFQSFGPFSSENLHSFSPVLNDFAEEVPNTVQNDAASDRKPLPVTTEISSTRFTLDSSHPRNPSMLQTSSPNSVLESSGSCSAGKNLSTSHELLVPVRTRTRIPRRSTFSKLHSLSPSTPPKKISDIKGKKKKKIKRTRLLYESETKEDSHHQHVSSKKCTHCEAERTPQWREGPMGPRTLCNACGVHYQRSRKLFPEHQPIASPGSDTGKFPCTRRKEKKMKLSTELEKDAINQLPEKCQIVEDPTHPCKKCTECDVTETPQWREGPMGPSTLCNACGVRYRSGRLLPESHPTAGPNKNARMSTRLQEKKLALLGLPNDSMTKGVVTPDRVKRCTHCQATKTPKWREGPMGPKTLCNACGFRYRFGSGLPNDSMTNGVVTPDRVKRCTHCQATKTPQWREGPMGRKTLCNACGVRYRAGCLVPEYRPAASPTFIPCLHSNKRRNVIQMRMREQPVPETSNSEKDPAVFPPA